MCYRVAQESRKGPYLKTFRSPQIQFPVDVPRFNVSPTDPIIALAIRDGEPTLSEYRWGLIPAWAENPEANVSLANARSETADEKPSFRSAYKKRRCVIPVRGFFEWFKSGKEKHPYFFHQQDGELLPLAGLWEEWNKSGEPIVSATILTTEANALMAPIHDRMPVVLDPDDVDFWIDPDADPQALKPLLRPSERDDLGAYRVTTRMNSSRYNEPDAIEPLSDAPPTTLFPVMEPG